MDIIMQISHLAALSRNDIVIADFYDLERNQLVLLSESEDHRSAEFRMSRLLDDL